MEEETVDTVEAQQDLVAPVQEQEAEQEVIQEQAV
jgi:hypothetical protein